MYLLQNLEKGTAFPSLLRLDLDEPERPVA